MQEVTLEPEEEADVEITEDVCVYIDPGIARKPPSGLKIGDRVELTNLNWVRDAKHQGTTGIIEEYESDAAFMIRFDNGKFSWAQMNEITILPKEAKEIA
jgi:hypothetical protein